MAVRQADRNEGRKRKESKAYVPIGASRGRGRPRTINKRGAGVRRKVPLSAVKEVLLAKAQADAKFKLEQAKANGDKSITLSIPADCLMDVQEIIDRHNRNDTYE